MAADSGGSQNQANQPRTGERRRHGRLDVRDGVVFSDGAGERPPREGVITERSAAGLRIETRHPEAVGSVVEVEVKSSVSGVDELLFLQGVVIHVTVLDSGISAMGILLRPSLGKAGGPDTSYESARVLEVKLPDALRALENAISDDGARAADATPARELASFRKIGDEEPSRHRSLWIAAVVILIILVVLFLMGVQVRELINDARGPSASATIGGDSSEDAIPDDGTEGVSGTVFKDVEPAVEARVSDAVFLMEATPGALLSRAEATLDAGLSLGAAEIFEAVESRSDVTPTQRFIALLGHARAAELRGEHGLALELVRRAVALGDAVPETWRDEAAALDEMLWGGDATASGLAAMDHVLSIAEESSGTASTPTVRVEVDTSDYVMTVIRGDKVAARFPVGLGWDGTTPLGEFSIANKISDPDWYNRGEVVVAGDPRNPLGGQWMGLGQDGRATSYGIHPSNDPRAIGQPFSRGCVRMRPKDAEALFRLVPVGTPVTIRP